jgi:ribosomal protein S18 acetylase RimI-like enzyme
MGLLYELKQWFPRPDMRCISVDEAIALFKANPIAWFTCHQEPYRWPERRNNTAGFAASLPNVGVLVRGHHIADMERATIEGATARIQHVGVASELTGRGIGPVLLRTMAHEMACRYGVTCIVFSEESTKYHEKGYEKFFAKIGARRLTARWDQKPDRPDFEWRRANW